jgi:hypothetical protein
MKSTVLNAMIDEVHSTAAISARAKENIRMQAQRYQRGSLSLQKRKANPMHGSSVITPKRTGAVSTRKRSWAQ